MKKKLKIKIKNEKTSNKSSSARKLSQKKLSRTSLEILDYDSNETTAFVDPRQALTLQDLDLKLPPIPPTQVVSIRLPSQLLNELRAMGSQTDVPYQALIKLFLTEAVAEKQRKRAA